MATKRIYLVGPRTDSALGTVDHAPRLVEASTQAEAIRHIAKKYKATVATSRQVYDLRNAGVMVEEPDAEVAGDEPAGAQS